MEVSINGGSPQSSILVGFSFANHAFWGTPIYGTPQVATDEQSAPGMQRHQAPIGQSCLGLFRRGDYIPQQKSGTKRWKTHLEILWKSDGNRWKPQEMYGDLLKSYGNQWKSSSRKSYPRRGNLWQIISGNPIEIWGPPKNWNMWFMQFMPTSWIIQWEPPVNRDKW